MTPDAIRAAALRNRTIRAGQLARIAPVVNAAKQPRADLEAIREQAKSVRANVETMHRLQSVPNFFPTPRDLCRRLIHEADVSEGLRVLEPSAGKGDLAAEIVSAGAQVECYEIAYALSSILREKGFTLLGGDFLEALPDPRFDRVVMNPPFERGIDVAHVQHAYKFLKPGGILAAIVGSTSGRKLEGWAIDRHGYVEDLPAGSFLNSDRSTAVNTALVVAHR